MTSMTFNPSSFPQQSVDPDLLKTPECKVNTYKVSHGRNGAPLLAPTTPPPLPPPIWVKHTPVHEC